MKTVVVCSRTAMTVLSGQFGLWIRRNWFSKFGDGTWKSLVLRTLLCFMVERIAQVNSMHKFIIMLRNVLSNSNSCHEFSLDGGNNNTCVVSDVWFSHMWMPLLVVFHERHMELVVRNWIVQSYVWLRCTILSWQPCGCSTVFAGLTVLIAIDEWGASVDGWIAPAIVVCGWRDSPRSSFVDDVTHSTSCY